jgi:hypothetical protein
MFRTPAQVSLHVSPLCCIIATWQREEADEVYRLCAARVGDVWQAFWSWKAAATLAAGYVGSAIVGFLFIVSDHLCPDSIESIHE